jgi:hypothetical protein
MVLQIMSWEDNCDCHERTGGIWRASAKSPDQLRVLKYCCTHILNLPLSAETVPIASESSRDIFSLYASSPLPFRWTWFFPKNVSHLPRTRPEFAARICWQYPKLCSILWSMRRNVSICTLNFCRHGCSTRFH